MVAVDQMARLVGHDVFHRGHGGLDQLPVDPQDAVLAAGAPHPLLVADASAQPGADPRRPRTVIQDRDESVGFTPVSRRWRLTVA